jgi:hypothetical protein
VWHTASLTRKCKCTHTSNQTKGHAGKHDINKASFGSEFKKKKSSYHSNLVTNRRSASPFALDAMML